MWLLLQAVLILTYILLRSILYPRRVSKTVAVSKIVHLKAHKLYRV